MKPHRRRAPLLEPQAEINVTPFVDVMLVLLIVFMVTAPMMAAGLKVDLPPAGAARPLNPRDPVVVSVAKDGSLSVGVEAVTTDTLAGEVRRRMEGDGERLVHIRGDRTAAHGDIVKVMDVLSSAGITRLAIVAETRATADGARP